MGLFFRFVFVFCLFVGIALFNRGAVEVVFVSVGYFASLFFVFDKFYFYARIVRSSVGFSVFQVGLV